MKKFVKVPIDVYKALDKADDVLLALQSAGVDNWDGYDYAFEDFDENELSDSEIAYEIIEED